MLTTNDFININSSSLDNVDFSLQTSSNGKLSMF